LTSTCLYLDLRPFFLGGGAILISKVGHTDLVFVGMWSGFGLRMQDYKSLCQRLRFVPP